MSSVNPNINDSWKNILWESFQADYFSKLKAFLVEEKNKANIFPPGSLIFNAFNSTPFDKVKVVILGQDPYHGDGQAHGLCFSVPKGIKIPPSLVNIYKELNNDLGISIPKHGNLESWARKGVLLLNATLTVRAHQAGSHQNKGWEKFTDEVIQKLSSEKNNLVFVLWGSYAQSKSKLIDSNKHCILKAVHPSPLSANRGGFFGTRPFSKCNSYLSDHNIEPINWAIDA
ncbi:MAG: uracil-DNA glycosylase [Bacteroidales bacterium]|nr:uracil-DNA glycosylase [Bacteroidales bacterium]